MSEQTSKKRLVLNSIIYSFSGLLLKCFSFFLLPLYSAYLTTADYGITSLVTSFIYTFGFVVAFSLFSAVMRFYVDYKDDEEKLKRFYGTISSFVFLSAILFAIFVWFFQSFFSKYVFQGVAYYPIILISTISLVLYCQQTIYGTILQSQQKAFKCSAMSIFSFFTTFAGNIIFVVVLKMGAVGSLLAMLISYFLYTAYFMYDVIRYKQITFCLDFGILKDALSYSIPIMPHNLSTQISLLVSKMLIGGQVSLSGVGIYAIASQFGDISDTIQSYVDQAYGPWLYTKLHAKEEGFKEGIRSISKVLTLVLGLFFIGIALFSQDYIILFLNESYADAWRFVPLVVITYVIKIAYYFYVEVLFYYKEASKRLFIATLSSSILNIILTSIMVPIYGIYGSIYADIIAMFLRVGIIVYISSKYDDIGLHIIDFIKNGLLITLFIFVGLSLSYFKYGNSFSIYNFIFKIMVVIVYILIVYMMNRNEFKPVISKMFSILKNKFS